MQEIIKFTAGANSNYKFSIVIPSWNNLEYLKLCVGSIRKNSHFKHQIIIHVNEGTDGTLEWVKENKLDYSYSKKNMGICYPLNLARTLLQTDYYLYMNDDMYVCPNWDMELWKAIDKRDNTMLFYSATMIEPEKSGNNCVVSPYNFGRDSDTFDEEKLLKEYQNLIIEDWSGATWPPNIIHKDLWDLVGGYSVEFSPGMNSDPDFSKKLWEAGVRDFKGIGTSLVYHFMSKSTGRIEKNNGSKQFLLKWGLTSATFTNEVLRRGKPALDELTEPNSASYKRQLLKSRIKRFFIMR